jgi:hypothetical protein
MSIQANLFGEHVNIQGEKLPPVDIFMTGVTTRIPLCCIISEFEFKVGMRSNETFYCKNCKLDFMDNKFLDYNHAEHMKNVLKFKPKYSTIRDYFSEDQSKMLGVKYYSLEELKSHADIFIENEITPIIIPKFIDSLNEIEKIDNFNKYVVGAMLAGKFGKTKKIPVHEYVDRGYKIHLLGNSPEAQIKLYKKYPDNIVSMDSAVIASCVMSKMIWNPKRSLVQTVNCNIDKLKFPRPGYAMASLAMSISMSNLYNYVIGECDGI